MTARVIGRSLYLRAEIFGSAAVDCCRLRRGQMIAPRVGNSKCLDESDDVRIERPQCGRLPAAALVVAIFAFGYPFHPAPITRGVCVVERAGRLLSCKRMRPRRIGPFAGKVDLGVSLGDGLERLSRALRELRPGTLRSRALPSAAPC